MKKVLSFLTMLLFIVFAGYAQVELPVFVEDFEGGTLNGWTTIDSDGDLFNWGNSNDLLGAGYGHDGSNYCAFSQSYDNDFEALEPDNWLISPAITLNEGSSTLSFWVCGQDASWCQEHYAVYVSTTTPDINAFGDPVFEETIPAVSARDQSPWRQISVDLSDYAGQTIYIAFRHYDVSDEFYLDLDDIVVTSVTSNPMLVVSPIEADFSLVIVGEAATRTVTVNGYNLTDVITATSTSPFEISSDGETFDYSATLPSTGGTLTIRYAPTMSGTDEGTITISSANVSDATIAVTGSSRDCSFITMPLLETFEENSTSLDCWTIISMNTENSIQLGYLEEGSSDRILRFSSYSQASNNDYDQYLITPMLPETENEKVFSFDYLPHSTYGSETYKIGYSTTTNELTAFEWEEEITVPYSTEWAFKSFNVPGDAKYIVINYTSNDQYYLYINNVMVEEMADCMSPNNIVVSNIGANSANISWTSRGEEELWQVVVVEHGEDPETGMTQDAEETSFTVTDLAPGTQYDVYVKAECASGSSVWSPACTFTTTPDCSNPSNIQFSNITGTLANVSWTAAPYGDITDYVVEYSIAEEEDWMSITVEGATTCVLTGLQPQTEYNVRISSVCNSETMEPTPVTASFTTNCLVGGTVLIGEGTETSSYFLSSSCYNYSFSEQLFTQNEIGVANTLRSLSVNCSQIESPIRQLVIYLMHTSESALNTEWLPLTDAQIVYSGSYTFAEGWNTIPFDSVFEYNGEDNLLLAVDDNSGTWSCSNNFYVHNISNGKSLYYQSDGTNVDPMNISVPASSQSSRNNVKFGSDCIEGVTCIAPMITNAETTTDEITVTWIPGYQETAWNLSYKDVSEDEWIYVGSVTSPYTISDLQPDVTYKIQLISDCGGEESAPAFVTATTRCVTYDELPFAENFDNSTAMPSCWTMGGNMNDYPVITSSAYSSPNHSLEFASSSDGYTYAALPTFGETIDMSNLWVSFNMKGYTDVFIEVGIMDDPEDYSTFTVIDRYTVLEEDDNAWVPVEIVTSNYTGEGHNLAFRSPAGSYFYPYIDDIVVDVMPACYHVLNLAVGNTEPTSVTIEWNLGGEESAWDYVYGIHGTNVLEEGSIESVYDEPSVTLENLEPNTHYDIYVRANCGGEESEWRMLSFRSGCVDLTAPYTENFDSYQGKESNPSHNILPNCWSYLNTGTYSSAMYFPFIQKNNDNARSGQNALYFSTSNYDDYGYNYGDQYAILPRIDVDAMPINTLELSFYAKGYEYYGPFQLVVGVMEDPTDPETFEAVDTVSGGAAYNSFDVSFASYTGEGSYIALLAPKPSESYETNEVHVDDIDLHLLQNCSRPASITVDNSTEATAITLSWEVIDETQTEWEIEYGPQGFALGTGETATFDAPYGTIEDLENIVYDFYVRSLCGEERSNARGPVSAKPNSLNISTTGSDTIHSCAATIYDQGGAEGNYVNNTNYTLVIYPDQEGMLSKITGSYDLEASYDILYIYDGVGTADLLWQSSMNYSDAQQGTVDVVSITGPLTLYFHSDFSTSYGGFELNVSCEEAPSCIKPTNLSVDNVTNNEVTLSWNENGTAANWNIEYGPAGFTLGEGTVINVEDENPYTVTGLESATMYDFYVQADCGDDDVSEWSNVITATTLCDAFAMPFVENFNTLSAGIPTCWDNSEGTTIDEAFKWNYYATGYEGAGLRFNSYANSNGNTNTLKTPVISIVSGAALSFYYKNPTGGDFSVYVIANGTQMLLEGGLVGMSEWTRQNYDLSEYDGQDVQIAFVGTSNWGYDDAYIYLDSVAVLVSSTPIETCDAPTQVAASNIAQTTAIITWTAGGDETAWNLQYKAAADANWSSSIAVNDEPSYELSGLTANTQYNVRVQAVCSEDATSQWANGSFTTLAEDVPTCPSPTNVTVTDIQNHSAVIDWEQADNTVTSWDVNYKKSSSAVWTSVTTESKPYTLTNLEGLTEYDVQVLAHCEGDLVSDPSEVQHFTTTNVGVNEYDMDGVVSVYPNPTNGQFTIDNAQCTISSVDVYDVYGKLIGTMKVEDTHATLDIRGYADGVYFLRVVTENGVVTKRIVKK